MLVTVITPVDAFALAVIPSTDPTAKLSSTNLVVP